MSFNLILPKEGSYKKTTKDMVLTILTEEHPLTLKQIFDSIRKRYGISITYAAIRKSTLELVRDHVLIQIGKRYQLDRNWILEIRSFVDSMQRNYLEGYKPLEKVDVGENVIVYTVNNIYQAERIWGELIMKWAEATSGSGHIATFQTYHIWTTLFHLDWEEQQIIAMRKKNVKMYAAVYSATAPVFLDKIAVKFYKDSGVQAQLLYDKDFVRGCELGTYDDIVLQIYHPPEIANELDKFYARVRRPEDMNLAKISEIAKRDVPVRISVFKNAELANQIRNSMLKKFKLKF